MNSESNRRGFLKIPVAAAGAAALMPLSSCVRRPLPPQNASDSVALGVIGVGNRGGFLLDRLRRNPAASVRGLCDIVPERLDRAMKTAAAAGFNPGRCSDYQALLRRDDIQAVVIATPVDRHKEMSIAALQAGKNVYCEKPLGLAAEECRLVAKAAAEASGIFQCGFQYRHDPCRAAAVRFIRQGGLGKVLFLQGYRHSPDPYRQIGWLYDRLRSGDLIVEQACHIIDEMIWVAGTHPLRAFGSGGINLYRGQPPNRTTMDNYSIIYEFPDDVRFCFSHILFDPPHFSGIKERVFGSRGAIDLATATFHEHGKKNEKRLGVPNRDEDGTDLSLASFLDNVRAKKKPLNCAESARISTLAAIMGRKSVYERRIVSWAEVEA